MTCGACRFEALVSLRSCACIRCRLFYLRDLFVVCNCMVVFACWLFSLSYMLSVAVQSRSELSLSLSLSLYAFRSYELARFAHPSAHYARLAGQQKSISMNFLPPFTSSSQALLAWDGAARPDQPCSSRPDRPARPS